MNDVTLNGDKKRVMPREVYCQCLWLVRDMERLETIADMLPVFEKRSEKEVVFIADDTEDLVSVDLINEAVRRLNCINDALDTIPEEYRKGIIEIIKNVRPFYPDTAHENTWNKWKHCFIYRLARNMDMF